MRATLVVRDVMKQHGKTMIWTNKYQHCRTVKCWAGAPNDKAHAALEADITAALRANGTRGIGFRPLTNSGSGHAYPAMNSFIVRLPLE